MRARLFAVAVAVCWAIGLSVGGAAAASPPSPTFSKALVPVGTQPLSVGMGDFNGDGRRDLAVANWGSNTVTILLGNTSGAFTQASGSPITVGTAPQSVAVGDFNGDGRPDLAVANGGTSTVSILLGNGNGTFTQASGSPIVVGSGPESVVVGDLNGDRKPDLAVANYTSGTVSILLGNGNGTFASSGSPVSVGSSPQSIALGDLNGDGTPDLAATNRLANTVSILLGHGGGTFAPAARSPI